MNGDGTVEPGGHDAEREAAGERPDADLRDGGERAILRSDGPVARVGSRGPRRDHRTLLGSLALAVAIALVGVTAFVTGAGPAPTPSPAAVRPSPSPSAAAATAAPRSPQPTSPTQPTPAPTPQDWAAAVLPPIEPVADLVATRTEPGGTSIRTAFALTSHSAIAAVDLAKGLETTPPVELAVSAGATAGTAILRPKAPLATGTTYRATLHLPGGTLGGSWIFQTSRPPRIARTLPGNRATDVPLDTGVEITFDQDGVGDIAPFFSISPRVAGRFERHGRTAVFVPDAPLKPLTVYTVTVRGGVSKEASDLVLEEELTFQFETAPKAGPTPTPKPEAYIAAAQDLVEAGTAVRPVLELQAYWPGSGKSLSRVDLRVYRFPTVGDAIDAYLAFRASPDWSDSTDAGLVRTAGLAEVAWFSAVYQPWAGNGQRSGWLRFPDPLAPGWYLVDIPRRGRDVQVFLQVTDVQTTTILGSGRALVWANDLATGGPLAGAAVTTLDGELVGRTDADGLMLAAAPARLLSADLAADPRAGVLVVRAADGPADGAAVPGRASFVPVAGWTADPPFEDRFWRLLYTDRSLFRQVDTIEAWGLVLPRDGGAIPEAELRLTTGYWYDDAGEPPAAIARAAVDPDPGTGVFSVPLPLSGLPIGDYELGLWIGNHRIAATSIRVGVIRKPAYQLEVATDRRVVVDGDTLTATVTATFFDGTRAPGIAIAVGLAGWGEEHRATQTATTGAEGAGRTALVVDPAHPWEQWGWGSVDAWPAAPEEAEITASAPLLAFRSRVVLDGEAAVAGATLQVRGSLHAVDLERLEREQRNGYEGEIRPQGAAVAGSTVAAAIVEEWDVRIPAGRVYDFIAKKSVETYDYETRSKDLGTRRVRTDARGGFALDLPAPAAGHHYTITLGTADADGRPTSLELWVPEERWDDSRYASAWPSLHLETPAAQSEGDPAYAVGDPIRATVRAGSGAVMPAEGKHRYLFFVARPGLLEARVQASPAFTGTFTAADVPSLTIGAVWFDGSAGGSSSGMGWGCGGSLPFVEARIDPASRPVRVQLSADAARYRPGGTVTLAVRTTDAAGRPVRSTVVLRAIDEKLYAIGGADQIDAADDLYWWLASENGIAAQATSHQVPVYRPNPMFTCGGGIGGREGVSTRTDLRDTLLFRRVATGADGRATVSFDLSDDLTSWRISATAVSRSLGVGQATLLVPVGLPLFIEAPLAPDYLAGERPVLRVRAYGDALAAGVPVTFTVAAPSLGMSETRAVGAAFTAVEIPLPALTAGHHEVLVTASAGSGAGAAADRLVRKIHVIDTRFTQRRTVYADLADGLPRAGGTGLVSVVFADAGRARFVGPLESLAAGYGERVDQALAAAIARDLLVTAFDADPALFKTPAFDQRRYQVTDTSWNESAGIRLLPYASADLGLSARVALVAGDQFDVDQLRAYLDSRVHEDEATSESRHIALAGLAGLGDSDLDGVPLLDQLRSTLAAPNLTIRERLYLALGAAALGDHATAFAVERELLATHGERLGPWLRLRVGSSMDDTIEATALVALIGATVGDPIAEWAEAYVEENRAADDIFNLQQVGYISRVLERTPAEAARVAYALGGVERTLEVGAGGTLSLTLTPAQAATLTARTAAGRVGVAVSWDDPVDPATLPQDPSLTLARTVSPAGPVPSDGLVEVTLRTTFGPQAVDGCYTAVDVLPSGLAPLGDSGQRVAFCLSPGKDRTASVSYRARVVTPGTYRWEPAILQSAVASESLAITPPIELEIR